MGAHDSKRRGHDSKRRVDGLILELDDGGVGRHEATIASRSAIFTSHSSAIAVQLSVMGFPVQIITREPAVMGLPVRMMSLPDRILSHAGGAIARPPRALAPRR